jgi:NADPH:quinone reductase-like Zn-dependent oxidoreductase
MLPRSATGRDLLVEVRAVSVNPVDYKVRSSAAPPPGAAKVIGYDAAGVVVEAGPQASLFRPGDEVFYAGSNIRSGTNAELHLVDERIVGHKPRSLGFAEAAALPLTSITAWEALFDRMDIRKPVAGAAPRGSYHRRCWRRRLDRDPARPNAHQSHSGGDRLAPRDDELGQGSRRPSRHRP